MERIFYMARLKPEKVEDYRRVHQTVWPELITEATRSGIKNHGCFLRGRDLIIYLETDSYQNTLADFNAKEVVKKWDSFMSEFFDLTFPSQEFEPWDEVFHMD